LSDIAGDWGNPTAGDFAAVVDVMAFRHNDGHINIEKLRHAVRLTTVLLDLQSDDKVTDFRIGIANLAPLLLAQAVAYDSEAGRALCAAICGLVTAEAFAVSAELAALRGASASFFAERETILRVLRNHSRAVHGDKTDYEKISVLPHPLSLQHCPDLALAAAAQSRWSEVLHRVRQNGLRQTQVTSLQGVPTITAFMESVTQGVEALSALTMLRQTDDDDFQNDVLPAVPEALERLGYDRTLKPENVRASHKGIFAVSEKVRVEARIQMAAAVQGLISGDTGLTVSLPVNSTAENNERLLLSAWRQGVRSLSMDFDAAPVTKKIVEKKAARKIRASEFIHTTQPPTSLPRRGARLKAASSLVHMEHRPKPLLGRGKRG
jgi:ribonucleotide reductase alpha subunit